MSTQAVVLADAPFPGPWRAKGACRQVAPSVFFPNGDDEAAPALAVCARCPVATDCRNYALAVPGLKGVWGGLTEAQRKRLRSQPGADLKLQHSTPAPRGPSASPPGTLLAHLEQLVAHEGRWARVAQFASKYSAAAMASLLRRGRRPAPAGRWSFEGRSDDGGGSSLWARYDGPGSGVGSGTEPS